MSGLWSFIYQVWPISLQTSLPWEWLDKLRYKDTPYIPILGENPNYLAQDVAWYSEVRTVFPHTRRHRAMRAICKNDFIELKKALDEGFDVDSPIEYTKEKTAAGLAAYLGRTMLLHYLIIRGANLDKGDKLGNTPLKDAVERVNLECAIELVQHGATVDKENLFNRSALDRAANHEQKAVEDFLQQAAKSPKPHALPAFDIRLRFEDLLEDYDIPPKGKPRTCYMPGNTYPFNSLSGTYVVNLYSEKLITE